MAAASLLASACGTGGNVYPIPAQEAYSKLASASVERSGKGPFGMMEIEANGDGSSTISWSAVEGFGATLCEANVTPEGADKSRIMVYCNSGGEGAAAGMTQGLYRKAMIEHIDSTLRGRPYDHKRALGVTAATWPDDPRQPDGSYAGMVRDAVKMQREAQDMIDEAEQIEADMKEGSGVSRRPVNFKPGEPMITPSN